MDNRYTFVIKNTIFGAFVGGSYVLASLIFYWAGKTVHLNPQLNQVLLLLSIVGGFIGTRKYREDHLGGYLSYGKALGICIYLLSVASVLYGIFIYLLYTIDPNLQANYLNHTIQLMQEIYKDSPILENMKSLVQTYMTSGIIAFSEIVNKIFTSCIFSLLLAGILRRKQHNI